MLLLALLNLLHAVYRFFFVFFLGGGGGGCVFFFFWGGGGEGVILPEYQYHDHIHAGPQHFVGFTWVQSVSLMGAPYDIGTSGDRVVSWKI